jgi:6-phosphofructokinase 1
LATRLGAAAVQALMDGQSGVLCGLQKGEIAYTPHAQVASGTKSIDLQVMQLAKVLAK